MLAKAKLRLECNLRHANDGRKHFFTATPAALFPKPGEAKIITDKAVDTAKKVISHKQRQSVITEIARNLKLRKK